MDTNLIIDPRVAVLRSRAEARRALKQKAIAALPGSIANPINLRSSVGSADSGDETMPTGFKAKSGKNVKNFSGLDINNSGLSTGAGSS